MCGIAGIFLRQGTVDLSRLEGMGRCQQHRGPDHFATWARENIGVAHNRLSIIDLTPAGNQPFTNQGYVLCYNGEIYNYRALKDHLSDLNINFVGTSDTEVLFHHLIRFGVRQTLEQLRGMFAFSFWDLEEKVVYLCRDRLGIKPLVWTADDRGIYWASEVKGLRRATAIEPDPLKTLLSTASLAERSTDYTVFTNVRQVNPGTFLVCRDGRPVESIRYYDLTREVDRRYYQDLDGMAPDTLRAHFRGLLERSVESMLMSDAPMGVFVSGGIDSSLVALAATEKKAGLSLFTANVVGRYSEFEDARRLSASVGCPLHASRFTPEMMLSDWVMATYHYECPIVIHTNAIPFATVARIAREQGVKAVLTGEGSDELFLGYPWLPAQRYRRLASLPVDGLMLLYSLAPRLRRFLFPREAQMMFGFVEGVVTDFERRILGDESLEMYAFLPKKRAREQAQTPVMLRDHLCSLLHRNDRMGMMHSIESRFPFLDEDVVHFGLNLPIRWKVGVAARWHNWRHPFLIDKRIVRDLAAARLPKDLVRKPKEGFSMYGHRHVRVSPGYFRDGYVADLVGLSSRGEEYMLRTEAPELIARLVSVDVFGRLFALNQPAEEVTRRILSHVTLST